MMKGNCFLISAVFSGALLTAQIPTANLMGYWPMDGNAQDYSGNANHGTVMGATLTTDRFLNPNMAYGFDGVNASIIVNNSPTVDMTNNTDFSVAFWIKTYAGPTTNGLPLSKNVYGSWSGYQFLTNNIDPGYCTNPGQISWYTASGAFQDACSDSNVSVCDGEGIDRWYFITGVYDSQMSQSILYINAVAQADIGAPGGNLSNAANLVFGAHPNNILHFKGALDGVRIYKSKLTQSEIISLYNETNTITELSNHNQIPKNMSVFPNPVSELLNLWFYSVSDNETEINVFDTLGKVVQSNRTKITTGPNKILLNTEKLADGIYTIRLKNNDSAIDMKFSVMH